MRRKQRRTYEPTAVYALASQVKERGIHLSDAIGPWRAGERRASRPGRTCVHELPVVTNEHTAVVVDTPERAEDIAGLLNWCGVKELEPVPELVPDASPGATGVVTPDHQSSVPPAGEQT
ncbi:MAG: hypothetical protein ACTHM9_09695 [Gemmatimonadales bacterium]